jgi:DNA-binding transcriptional regulator YiaG
MTSDSALKVIRQTLGLSVDELAEMIPCDPEYVAGVEEGRNRPTSGWWSRTAWAVAQGPVQGRLW